MEICMLKVVNGHDLEVYFSLAYEWLRKSRKHYPPSSDIWDFRRCWHERKESIVNSFLAGSYHFDLPKRIRLSADERIAIWSSGDALILKVLTILIQKWLHPVLPKTCYHLKGQGGLKGGVIKLHDYIKDHKVIFYIWQFLNRTIEWGGLYQEVKRGISRGSSLSPVLSAFYLLDLDLGFICLGECGMIIRKRERTMVEKKFFRYLINKPNGSASSLEIIKDLSLKTTNEGFNSIIENLYYRGLILMPHRQSVVSSDLKYDLITISKTGKESIKN